MASGRRLGRAAGPGASPPPGRFTDRPLCRLQVHLPLSLSRARLPGLQRAPGPGLGTGAGAGYERGECGPGARAKLGSTCGRAPRKASAGERPKGWLPCGDPLTARRVAGAVLPTARARPAPRRAALLHFRPAPASGLAATLVHMRTRLVCLRRGPGVLGGAERSCVSREVTPGGPARRRSAPTRRALDPDRRRFRVNG